MRTSDDQWRAEEDERKTRRFARPSMLCVSRRIEKFSSIDPFRQLSSVSACEVRVSREERRKNEKGEEETNCSREQGRFL